MTLEDRLRDAFAALDAVEPSPDAVERIERAVEQDASARRWTVLIVVIGSTVATALVGSMLWLLQGGTDMPWWILELITTAVLFGLALFLGPFIRRFGKSYVGDVFRANPRTGKSFILLMDVAFYLIFAAYILMTATFEARGEWFVFDGTSFEATVGAAQLQWETLRVGGILLIVGVLHAVNVVILPAIGRLFTLNLRLDERTLRDRD